MVIVVLHSDTFYFYLYFHSAWWWLLSYIQTPSTAICTSPKTDGDCCLTWRSSTVSYIQTPSPAMCTSTQSDGDCCPTFRHLLLLFVLPLRLMVIVVLHSDTFYCHLYFHSAWWWLLFYIQTPSTAICNSTQHDGYCYSTFRHLLLLCVIPLSLMVIVILHSDTFYCYLYFHILMVIVVLHSDTYCHLYFH